MSPLSSSPSNDPTTWLYDAFNLTVPPLVDLNASVWETRNLAQEVTGEGHLGSFLVSDNVSTSTPGTPATPPLVSHSDTVVIAVTVILATNVAVSLSLNVLLMLIIHYSPSLRTPPNSHLLNICINNLMLCLDMVLWILCLTFNSVELGLDESEMLSGLQLFLTYNSLLQYWGTFASIGYYRHRTIKKPGLNLSSRRRLVSRCVTANWVVSSLLSMTLSLSYFHSSRFALSTLDPFMRSFHAEKDPKSSHEERVAVTLVILLAFSAGLIVILTAYHSICKTLNAVSYVGRNRIFPRQTSPHLQSDSSDLTLSMARSYRPQYTISSPSYLGGALSRDHKEVFQVMYNKSDNYVTIDDSQISPTVISEEDRSHRSVSSGQATPVPPAVEVTRSHSVYGQRRKLQATLSNTSNSTTASTRAPEFTDISIGADLLRFQRERQDSLHQRCPPFRRSDPISLSSAIRNSLAMLLTYCTCSLPLIVMSVPGAAWSESLASSQRVQVLMLCRILFSLNAPAYPLWYLCCSETVRKCFSRLWEAFMGKYGSAGRQ